jgi:predicted regulator of Ras-like GTPase activity (Roadblock/LC7/MglB family)
MNAIHTLVDALARLPGVRGAVVAAPDGVLVDSAVHADVRADVVAAFGAAVLASARGLAAAMGKPSPRCVAVEADGGKLCLTGNDDVTVIVLAGPGTPIGRLRMALRQALASLGS